MKTSVKHFLRIVLLLLVLGTGNLIYYVFAGQKVSAEKLQKGEELSIYECLSVYQMHMAVWSLGWPLAPQAARECFMLHFPVKKDTVKVYGKIDSPKIRSAIASLDTRASPSGWHGTGMRPMLFRVRSTRRPSPSIPATLRGGRIFPMTDHPTKWR